MALSTQRQEQPGSPPMGRPQQAEKAGGAAGGRPGMPGPTRLVQVHPLLAEIVDQIADWDFPDGGVARALRTKALPSTAPYLIAQYRVPMGTDHHFGSSDWSFWPSRSKSARLGLPGTRNTRLASGADVERDRSTH